MLNFIRNGTPYSGARGDNLAENAWLRWLAQDDESQQAHYVTLREYYDGDHNVPLTDRQEEYLERKGVDFRENYLRLPVDLLSQRLIVDGFDTGEDVQGGEDGLFWEWWQSSRMDAYQSDLHEAAIVDGDAYILVEWDDEQQMPTFVLERAYDGEEGVKVHYRNKRREISFASRRWREMDDNGQPFRRLNIYTPDTVYKYRHTGEEGEGAWTPIEEPQPWAAGVVPVVHFRHADDGTSNWGRSELEDLISDQEMLNKTMLDLLEIADKSAYQLITLSGGLAQTHDGSPMKVDVRSILSHKTGSWGVIPPGSLAEIRSLKSDFIIAIAQKSQIPLQYFQVTGAVASADTQRADDSNLVAKVTKLATKYGNMWEEVMRVARAVYNVSQRAQLPDTPINVVWQSFERVDPLGVELQRAQAVAQYVAAGASLEGVLSLPALDFTDEEREAMLDGARLSEIPDGDTEQ